MPLQDGIEENIQLFPSKHIDSIEALSVEAEEELVNWVYHHNVEAGIPLDMLIGILNRTLIYFSMAIESDDE
jgi:hypothetical protein